MNWGYSPRYLPGLGKLPPNPEINLPFLGLLPDVVFETLHQAGTIGRWDCLQEVCNFLPSPVHFQAQLAKTFI